MSLWRRATRYLTFTAMFGVVATGLVATNLVPGAQLAELSGRARACVELPGRAVPSQGERHLSYLGEEHDAYNSSPPTSGPHMPWIISTGVYRSPVPEEYQIHLLEHGNVLVQYPTGAPAQIRTELERFARRRSDVVVAPNDEVDRGVALSAWQRIELLREYDERRVERFISALARRYDHGWADGASDCLNASAGSGDSARGGGPA
jgi:hypothetical protein